MYYDIFFANPQGEIIAEPDPPVNGVLIQFPGHKQAVVYAVSDRGAKRFHCLVTTEQLAQIDEDNVNYKFFDVAENDFKRKEKVFDEDGNLVSETQKNWPAHVFNPAGCVFRKDGKDWIHKVKADTAEPLDVEAPE